jgi:diguanylate cyclase (GGDEF)-like protein
MTAPVLDHSADPPEEERIDAWPVPANEAQRVAALHAYGVLDQPRQPDLDALTRLAAYVCGTRQAAVHLVDERRQWPAAAFGHEPVELPRADALCAHVVTGPDVLHTADATLDPRFADSPLVTGRVASVRRYAAAPLVTEDGHSIGTLDVSDEQPGAFTDIQLALLRDLAGQVLALFEMRWMAGSLARIATRDALTGLANRRSVEQAITAAIARAERGLGTPSVVVIDLDGFAAVNDAFGRPAGDAVLRSVADRLTRTARAVDTVGRLGGDEFVVLLESTGGPGATAALARLRRSLQDGWGEVTGGSDEVAAALGISTYRPGDSVASLIARADAEMYADKSRRAAQRA